MSTKGDLHQKVRELPQWTDDPIDRLRHCVVLLAEDEYGDTQRVLTATYGMEEITGHRWTGLTLGDLRAILALIDMIEET